MVFAIGSPEGLQNSVTMGVVSSVWRQPDPGNPMVYIQTDAPINPCIQPDDVAIQIHQRPAAVSAIGISPRIRLLAVAQSERLRFSCSLPGGDKPAVWICTTAGETSSPGSTDRLVPRGSVGRRWPSIFNNAK